MPDARLPLLADSPAARALEDGFPGLRFEACLERDFRDSHDAAARPRVRFALALAFCTILGFLLLDHVLLDRPWRVPQDLLRNGLQLLLVTVAFALATPRPRGRLFHAVIQWVAAAFGICMVAAIVQAGDPQLQALAVSRLLLATFFFYFMLGMGFFAAVRCNAVVLAVLAGGAWVTAMPAEAAIHGLALLVCANLFAGAGCYWLEHANRLAFLERRLLAQVASRDGLTGLLNRAAFDAEMRRVWDQSVRECSSVTVIMLDLDHFKAFNDRYGHQAGDATLRAVAGVLRQIARRPLDIVARYGGEELVVILPGSDQAHAENTARALVQAVAALGIPHDASPTRGCVTASVGSATVEAVREPSHETAIRLADRAMYLAKEQGRDRHVVLDRSLNIVDFAGQPRSADSPPAAA